MSAVLITGARGGIGKALVEAFAEAGYSIIACTRKPDTAFDRYLVEIESKYNCKVYQAHFDTTDTTSMKQEVKRIFAVVERIDVLVNNAGVAHGGMFSMTKIQTIRDVFEVNLFSYMELTQLLLRGMLRKKSGCIINMASVAGLDLKAGNSAYGTSKACIIAWTKTLAAEMGQFGIRVNAIAPGLTDTNMAKQMEEKAGVSMLRESAMRRLAMPSEIADVAVYLASDKAAFINGQTIRVDGGTV